MPSKSLAQAKFMGACSHGAGYSSCPPAKVSKEFNKADTGKNWSKLPARVSKISGKGHQVGKR